MIIITLHTSPLLCYFVFMWKSDPKHKYRNISSKHMVKLLSFICINVKEFYRKILNTERFNRKHWIRFIFLLYTFYYNYLLWLWKLLSQVLHIYHFQELSDFKLFDLWSIAKVKKRLKNEQKSVGKEHRSHPTFFGYYGDIHIFGQ